MLKSNIKNPIIPKNSIWFVVEEIPNDHYFMMGYPSRGFVHDWHKHGLGGYVKHFVNEFKETHCRMLFIRKEFDKQAKYLSDKIIKNPDWALEWIKKCNQASTNFFKASKQILAKPEPEKLTNQQIINLLEKAFAQHYFFHSFGASIGWLADADREYFTHYIQNYLKKQIKNIMPKAD